MVCGEAGSDPPRVSHAVAYSPLLIASLQPQPSYVHERIYEGFPLTVVVITAPCVVPTITHGNPSFSSLEAWSRPSP